MFPEKTILKETAQILTPAQRGEFKEGNVTNISIDKFPSHPGAKDLARRQKQKQIAYIQDVARKFEVIATRMIDSLHLGDEAPTARGPSYVLAIIEHE